MIDHVNIPVSSLARSKPFYRAVLGALGQGIVAQDGPVIGFGTDRWSFGIEEVEGAFVPLHLAFVATSRHQVRDFHRIALASGGQCNGEPGERGFYGPGYYAAYVLDPDGHNIEAVLRSGGLPLD